MSVLQALKLLKTSGPRLGSRADQCPRVHSCFRRPRTVSAAAPSAEPAANVTTDERAGDTLMSRRPGVKVTARGSTSTAEPRETTQGVSIAPATLRRAATH